jgi:hypothetical protein
MQPNATPNAPPNAPAALPAPKKSRALLVVGIVVGLLVLCCCPMGILAGIAVPSFQQYIRRAKSTEARSELASLASAEEQWCLVHLSPLAGAGPLPAGAPGPEKQVGSFQLDPIFSQLGYEPYGPLYYQYSIVDEGAGGVVIRAEGDLDGDGVRSRFERRCTGCDCSAPLVVTDELE